MENNRTFLEVAWAAQRSGLHYTAINSHLRPAEVQYVLDDCGAVALVSSGAMARRGRRPRPAPRIARADRRRWATLPGFERYDEVLAAAAPGPLDDEREGREMLYSVGHHGPTEGRAQAAARHAVRRPVVGAGRRSPRASPRRGLGAGSVYLSPAPLYHAAPLVYSMSVHRLGAHRRA